MAEQVDDNSKFTGVRLPTTLKPSHYDLTLKPDLQRFTFEGQVKVDYVSGSSDLTSVVVNANELVISEGAAQGANQEARALKKVTYSKDTETATLDFDGPVGPTGTISLKFTGTLNDKLKGFYRTKFKIGDTEVHAATTQFEATDARRCFPCWDEPAIKASFTVTMLYDKEQKADGKTFERVALSNMLEVSRTEVAGGLTEVKFAKTPIMSTYLLAFIVGPFEVLEGTDSKRPIRIYTTPGKKEQGKYALEVACKSLPYYEDYFGVTYPLPKMDLVAIPDFAAGAMENWGLVTYRETCLLVDPNNTATSRKQYVAIVVAHELAHQWFGNLVTMEWWTHLWLNEGFATFMEFLCVDHIFPEYDIWQQFVTDTFEQALSLDSLHNSHPIEVPVNHPSEIDEIFDSISYSKGASVIRMMYNYIGDDCFRKGMKDYLTKFAYKNALTEDLWDALGAASNKPIRKLMSGWTSQKGYPWLAVSCTQHGDSVKLSLAQAKFTADGKLPEEEANDRWMIPINVVTGASPDKTIEVCLMEDKESEITVDGVGDSWVKLNPGTIDLYRAQYQSDMLTKLFPAISSQTLPPMDRLAIQSDIFALCQAGKVKTVDLLQLLEAFKGETNYSVWSSIDGCVGRLNVLLSNTDFQDKFQAFGRVLYADIYRKLTWAPIAGEPHVDAMTRAMVISRLVSLNDADVIAESKRRFKAHQEKTEMIPADLREAVYKAVSAHGDDATYESLFAMYRSSELHEEANRIARALASTKKLDRLERVVKFAFSDEVRNQDRVFFVGPIGVSNTQVAWNLLQTYKDFLREKYESGHIMSNIIRCTTVHFASEERAQEVAKFFEENKFPGAERTIQQSLETIRLSANWLARDSDSIKTFLSRSAGAV